MRLWDLKIYIIMLNIRNSELQSRNSELKKKVDSMRQN